jgi:hypothetical protein
MLNSNSVIYKLGVYFTVHFFHVDTCTLLSPFIFKMNCYSPLIGRLFLFINSLQ